MKTDDIDQYNAWELEYKQKGRLWTQYPVHTMHVSSNDQILELGVGNGKNIQGYLSNLLQPDKLEITVLDISRSALRLVKTNTNIPQDVFAIQADVCFLPFTDASYGIIFVVHLLDHLLEKKRELAVAEIQRILKPGGIIYITVFGVCDMRYGKGVLVEEHTFCKGNGIITHYFTSEELTSLFPSHYQVIIQKSAWEMRIKGKIHKREEFIITVQSLCK